MNKDEKECTELYKETRLLIFSTTPLSYDYSNSPSSINFNSYKASDPILEQSLIVKGNLQIKTN